MKSFVSLHITSFKISEANAIFKQTLKYEKISLTYEIKDMSDAHNWQWATNCTAYLPQFHLISWCGNFLERHSFRMVSGESPENRQKDIENGVLRPISNGIFFC